MPDDEIRLTLPLPPNPNDWGSVNKMAEAKKKNDYRKKAWIAAVSQAKPPRRPPSKARLVATVYTPESWDPDNRNASLKWVLDTLKQVQRGKMYWRNGLYDQCGYFVDDDDDHIKLLGQVHQEIDREDPRIEVAISYDDPGGGPEAA